MRRAAFAIVAGAAAIAIVWGRDGRTSPGRAARDVPAACDGFDYPVGAPDGAGYHDAQRFGINDHLGEDWNGVAGGDSDLGDPVRSIGAGVVSEAADHAGGWGNVVRIVHACDGEVVESLYAHLDTIDVVPGQIVGRGQRIGTIGTAHGQYVAHLHLELRERAGLPLGGGYGAGVEREGYLDPSEFIAANRPRQCR